MIYTVTFNPALDYCVPVENFTTGTVNRSHGEYINYGGKGINVAVVLHNTGIPCVAMGFVAGFTGYEIQMGVARLGVTSDFIELDQGLSRINVKIKSDVETEINGEGPVITEGDVTELLRRLDKLKDGDSLVLAGAIPSSLPDDIYEIIMERLNDRKIDITVDATGDLLMNVLKYHPFLIKPNNHELGDLFGVELHTQEEIVTYAKKLQDKGARNVLISMAGDGSILITEEGEVIPMGVPKGTVVNSVGAGDSMVAGFLSSYTREHDYRQALMYGTAAGSATAFSEGLATQEKIDELLEQLK